MYTVVIEKKMFKVIMVNDWGSWLSVCEESESIYSFYETFLVESAALRFLYAFIFFFV